MNGNVLKPNVTMSRSPYVPSFMPDGTVIADVNLVDDALKVLVACLYCSCSFICTAFSDIIFV